MVLLAHLHANFFWFCAKIQMQMFKFYICYELSFVQIISFHCTLCFLCILKMMMNAIATLHLMTKYSALHHVLLFAIPFLFIFNNFTSSSYLLLCSFFCASFFFATICSFSIALYALMFMWTPKPQKCSQLLLINKKTFDDFPVIFCPWTSYLLHSFFHFPVVFSLMLDLQN
jgi:hypothetical protein